MSKFKYSSLFQFRNDDTDYEFISSEGITQKKFNDKNILFIEPSVIRLAILLKEHLLTYLTY
jgi:hypothetical protein